MSDTLEESPTGSHVEPAGADDANDASEIEELRRRIEALQVDADKRLRAIVRERPVAVLGAAVALGFVLGRIMRRL
jgi:hypothetical protein